MTEEKSKKGFEWIKSKESGVSYLCPVGSVKDKDKATEQELKNACVDESTNPHND